MCGFVVCWLSCWSLFCSFCGAFINVLCCILFCFSVILNSLRYRSPLHRQLSSPDWLSVFLGIYVKTLFECVNCKEAARPESVLAVGGMEEDDAEINDLMKTLKYDIRIVASLTRNKQTRREV
jgi:hypothetical protein